MADTVTSQTIQDGQRKAVLKFTNVSDGTGEAAVVKVDVSAFTSKCQWGCLYWCNNTKNLLGLSWYGCQFIFDATANVLITGLPADSTGDEYYDNFTGIPNNAGSGKTGDVLFTTVGHSSGDTYSIILELVKEYG